MANTIHTMSMRLRQIISRDGGGSTVGPEMFPGIQGSCVVAGTCLLRKFPLAVDAISEPFPLASLELTLDICNPPKAVTSPLSLTLSSTVIISLAVALKFEATVVLLSTVVAVDTDSSKGELEFACTTSSSVGGSVPV